jgi:hypothetical protein
MCISLSWPTAGELRPSLFGLRLGLELILNVYFFVLADRWWIKTQTQTQTHFITAICDRQRDVPPGDLRHSLFGLRPKIFFITLSFVVLNDKCVYI